MNETGFDSNTIVNWLLGLVVAVFAFLGKRLHERIDEHGRKHVTREELDEKLETMREERERMHSENREDLHYIRERLDTALDRRKQ